MPEEKQSDNKEQFLSETSEKYSAKMGGSNSLSEVLSQEKYKQTKAKVPLKNTELSEEQVEVLEIASSVYNSVLNVSRVEWLSRLIKADSRSISDWFQRQASSKHHKLSVSQALESNVEVRGTREMDLSQLKVNKGASPKKQPKNSSRITGLKSDSIKPQLIREGNIHIQKSQCQNHVYSMFERCRSCIRKNGDVCRFKDFRTFQEDSKGQLIYGPAFQSSTEMIKPPIQSGRSKSSSKVSQRLIPIPKELLLLGSRLSLPMDVWMIHENYLRKIIAPSLLEIVDREITFMRETTCYQRATPIGVRQMCDICLTSIFNGFWLCCVCGVEMCLYCYDEWTSRNPKVNMCSYKRTHERPQMIRVSRISLKELQNLQSVLQPIVTSTDNLDWLKRSLKLDKNYLSQEMGYLADEYKNVSLEDFQEKWRKGETVVIRNLLDKIHLDWSPSYFIEHYGDDEADMVDCSTGRTVTGMTVGDFFRGFSDMKFRYENHERKHLVLRIKDWPSNMEFKDKFPRHFTDFMKALPFQEYTQRKGILNLASRLPIMVVPPDLGPKMYNAYGSDDGENGVGTTPLHLDMADAVNLMIYSIDPVGSNENNCQKLGNNPSVNNHHDAAAVWDIYHFRDLPTIRGFLREHAEKIGHSVDDPIHDQVFYLNETLRQQLFTKYGVRGWRVYQNPGDAVFVPAGCAHQVCNYKSCIKVAMDFVSPENVSRCAELTKEFRLLSQGHRRRQDLLQLESILYHSWLNSESAIRGEDVDELLPHKIEISINQKSPQKTRNKIVPKASEAEEPSKNTKTSRKRLTRTARSNDFSLDDEIVDLLSSSQSKSRKRSVYSHSSATTLKKFIQKKIHRAEPSSDSSLTDLSDLIESSDGSEEFDPSSRTVQSSRNHEQEDFFIDEEHVTCKEGRALRYSSGSRPSKAANTNRKNSLKHTINDENSSINTKFKHDAEQVSKKSRKLKKPEKPIPKIKLVLSTTERESDDLPVPKVSTSTETCDMPNTSSQDLSYNGSVVELAKDSDSEFAIALLGLSSAKKNGFSPSNSGNKWE